MKNKFLSVLEDQDWHGNDLFYQESSWIWRTDWAGVC